MHPLGSKKAEYWGRSHPPLSLLEDFKQGLPHRGFSLLQLIKDCNENVQRMKSTEELIYLSQKIEFECKVRTHPP